MTKQELLDLKPGDTIAFFSASLPGGKREMEIKYASKNIAPARKSYAERICRCAMSQASVVSDGWLLENDIDIFNEFGERVSGYEVVSRKVEAP